MTKTVFGIFTDREGAEASIRALEDQGYNPKDISFVMRDRRKAVDMAENTGADIAGGAVSGAATRAVAGGFLGTLMGLGLTHDEAEYYEGRVNEGAILLAVPARKGEELEVSDLLEEFGADDIKAAKLTEETEEMHEYPSAYAHSQYAGMKGGRSRSRVKKKKM